MKLSLLKEAFAPLSQIGIVRKTVAVHGVEVTLKTLNSKEESEVQKAISDQGSSEEMTTLEYVSLFRKHSLSFAVCGVNGVSFEDAYVETGETLENGTPVKIPRTEAIMELLDSLSTPVLSEMFKHLSVLSDEASGEVESEIDTDSETLEEKEKILAQQLEDVKQQKSIAQIGEIQEGATKSAYSDALKDMG